MRPPWIDDETVKLFFLIIAVYFGAVIAVGVSALAAVVYILCSAP